MSIWTLIQIICDVVFVAGFAVVAIRLRRPPQDDPRLSRGLQLLQTKITILEDLSDRTDQQFKQLNSMLEQKTRQLQNKILEAEQEILKIDNSMNKSLEVAEIFQDKIPHEEILERQRTIEYVKAARMAHSGMNVEDIAAQVNLPQDQVEMIAKFNRDQLMFDETQLPDWALKGAASVAPAETNTYSMGNMNFVQSLEAQPTDLSHMQNLEKEFRQAVQTAKDAAENPPHLMPNISMPSMPNISMPHIDTSGAREFAHNTGAALQKAAAPAMKGAVKGIRNTAESIKQKLVSTAEEILSSSSHGSGHGGGASNNSGAVANDTSLSGSKKERVIKKVIFPRIEDPN
jgi:hypothetical protein